MRVESLRVAGYRRLGSHEVAFADGLTLIVGPNNSGKTSLLQALAVLVGTGEAGHPGDNWAQDQTLTGGATVEAVLRPSEDEWRAACALLNTWEDRLEPGADYEPKAHAHVSSWPSGLLARVGRDPRRELAAAYELLPADRQREDHTTEHRLSDLARCLGDAFYRRKFSRKVLVDPVYLGGGARHVGPAESQLVGVKEYGNEHAAPGGRLSEYINLMTEQQRTDYAGALERVMGRDFVVATSFDKHAARLRMTVRDDPRWLLDADWQGGGSQWAMVVLAALYGPSWGPVLVDELETSLHPDLAVRLADLVREESLRVGRQVIATTQSDLIIADAEPGEIISMARAEPTGLWMGRSYSTDDQSALEEALDAIGVPGIAYSRRHLLEARVVVAVEGDFDRILLEILARKAGYQEFHKSGAALVGLHGKNQVNEALLVARILRRERVVPKPVIFVRDRDELTGSEMDELEARAQAEYTLLCVLDRRELENYLLDPEAIARVLCKRDAQLVRQTVVADVRSRLEQFADECKGYVRLQRIVRRLARGGNACDSFLRKAFEGVQPGTDGELEVLLAQVSDPEAQDRGREVWSEVSAALDSDWPARKLELCPGKKVFRKLRSWTKEAFSCQLERRGRDVVNELSEIPSDLGELFGAIRRHSECYTRGAWQDSQRGR